MHSLYPSRLAEARALRFHPPFALEVSPEPTGAQPVEEIVQRRNSAFSRQKSLISSSLAQNFDP